jgi:DNA-binding beta-propeller fold protein YncE
MKTLILSLTALLVLCGSSSSAHAAGILIWTDNLRNTVNGDKPGIYSGSVGGESFGAVVDGYDAYGLAVDQTNRAIYFTTLQSGTIYKSGFGGEGNTVKEVLSTSSFLGRIALDLPDKLMFWADRSAGTIMKAGLDGSNPTALVSNLKIPDGIALDLKNGLMYWTDSVSSGDIMVSKLDGSGRKVLVSDLDHPEGIALDIAGNRMFWADSGSGDIMTSKLDGTVSQVLVKGLNGPSGIALDLPDGLMFWTDYSGNDIMQAKLDGSNSMTLFTKQAGAADIAFLSVPEPSTALLLGIAAACVAVYMWRKSHESPMTCGHQPCGHQL